MPVTLTVCMSVTCECHSTDIRTSRFADRAYSGMCSCGMTAGMSLILPIYSGRDAYRNYSPLLSRELEKAVIRVSSLQQQDKNQCDLYPYVSKNVGRILNRRTLIKSFHLL
jgi:hypothetical protein